MREYRMAMIVSGLSMLCIVVAILFPEIFMQKPVKITPPAPPPPVRFHIPPKPVDDTPPPTHTSKQIKKNTVTIIKKRAQPVRHTASAKHAAIRKTGYYIQLGLFQQRARAEKMVKRLKHSHWKSHIVTRKKMYAVWIGPWKTRTQVDKTKHDIQINMGMKGFVIHSR